MRIVPTIAVACCVLTVLCAAEVLAQGFGGGTTSNSGTFGSRNLGGGIGSRSGSGGSIGLQSSEDVGQVTGSERYIRDNRQPGQFVGADTSESGSFVGQVGATGGTGIGQTGLGGRNNRNLQGQLGGLGLGGGLNVGGYGGQNFQNQNFQNQNYGQGYGGVGNTRTLPRAVMRVAFEVPTPSPTVLNTRITTRMTRIPKAHLNGNVAVQMEGTTAVLTGAVSNASDSDLAARLVMLEPGVEEVRNELVVDPSAVEQE